MSNAVAIGWLGMTNKEAIAKYEKHCTDNAEYFTAIRGRGFKRTRAEFATLDEAVAYAEGFGDVRTMIYGVTKGQHGGFIMNA